MNLRQVRAGLLLLLRCDAADTCRVRRREEDGMPGDVWQRVWSKARQKKVGMFSLAQRAAKQRKATQRSSSSSQQAER